MKNTNEIDTKLIIKNLPGHVYWVDKNGVILGCNDLQAKAVGLHSADEIIGRKIEEFQTQENAEIILNANSEVIKSGKSITVEEPFLDSKGITRIFLSNKVPLKDENGKIHGVLGISFDITAIKEKENQLTNLQNHTRLALDHIIKSLPGHVYWKDKDGVYLGCNDLQAKSLGYTSVTEIIGKTDFDLSPKKIADKFKKVDSRIINSGQPETLEEIATLAGNKETIFLSKKEPLHGENGEIIGILGISFDITELKMAQKNLALQVAKTEQAYKSKSEFLSIMTHEIRGPISNVYNYLTELEKKVNQMKTFFHVNVLNKFNIEEKRELLSQFNEVFNTIKEHNSICTNESQKALSYLDSLGELHKLQTAGVKSNFEQAELKSLIERAVKNTSYLNVHNIDVNISISHSIPDAIIFDYRNIYEALKVIIGNAIKYSHKNDVVIIRADLDNTPETKRIKLEVQDFGQGISEKALTNLFTDFSYNKEDNNLSRYFKPSLRLQQAKLKTEASGGELKIESVIEKGTKVTLFVPYFEDGALNIHKNETIIHETQKKLNILIIEDDPLAQIVPKSILENMGHIVVLAKNGTTGIYEYANNHFDLLILDITLPDMTGIDVIRELRQKVGDHFPFIIITSHSYEDDIDRFMSEGAITVLSKPVQAEQLIECVNTLIDSQYFD